MKNKLLIFLTAFSILLILTALGIITGHAASQTKPDVVLSCDQIAPLYQSHNGQFIAEGIGHCHVLRAARNTGDTSPAVTPYPGPSPIPTQIGPNPTATQPPAIPPMCQRRCSFACRMLGYC